MALYKPLLIDEFNGGLSNSVYQGQKGSFYELVGIDYRSEPGILQLSKQMTQATGTIRSKIKWFIDSTATEMYAIGDLTSSPHIYKSVGTTGTIGKTWTQIYTTNHLSEGNANGAEIWRGYMFIAGNRYLDVIQPTSGSDLIQWKDLGAENAQGSGYDSDYHPMYQSKGDGALYIGCGNLLARLSETTGDTFDPNDTASYAWTLSALDLPKGFRIRSIEEIGKYLLLGCWKSDATGIYSVAVLYPWNHILQSDSHEGPITLRRYGGITAMLNINNRLFTWVGARGEIYYYTGTSIKKAKKLPFNPGDYVYAGAVKANFNDMPVFGLRASNTYRTGIYSYGTVEEGTYPWSLGLDYVLSPGQATDIGVDAIATAGAIEQRILAGWHNGPTSYGIDYLDVSKYISSGAYLTTLLYRVGTAKQKQIIDGLEIFLDEELSTGQTINVKYRRKTSGAWTTITIRGNTSTMAFSEVGARKEINIPYPINDVVNLQFKVEFTSSANTNIKLREIRFT